MEEIKIVPEMLYLIYSLNSILLGLKIMMAISFCYVIDLLIERRNILSENAKIEKEYYSDTKHRIMGIESKLSMIEYEKEEKVLPILSNIKDRLMMIEYENIEEHLQFTKALRQNNKRFVIVVGLMLLIMIGLILVPDTKHGILLYVHGYSDTVNPEIFQYYLDRTERFVNSLK